MPPRKPPPRAKSAPPKRRPRLFFFFVAAIIGLLTAAWFGKVPVRYNPLAPPDLAEPRAWFLDSRLARLSDNREACTRILRQPFITAAPIEDLPYRNDCGWTNGFKVAEAGDARLHVSALTCESAAALALWMAHEVQPAAIEILGSRVTAVQQIGGYSCRNIVGNPMWADFRSQHATANAIDIASFTLADGRRVVLTKDWTGATPQAQFLRRVRDGACRYFRAVLSPDYNAAHRDHFHLDRGYIRSCR